MASELEWYGLYIFLSGFGLCVILACCCAVGEWNYRWRAASPPRARLGKAGPPLAGPAEAGADEAGTPLAGTAEAGTAKAGAAEAGAVEAGAAEAGAAKAGAAEAV